MTEEQAMRLAIEVRRKLDELDTPEERAEHLARVFVSLEHRRVKFVQRKR